MANKILIENLKQACQEYLNVIKKWDTFDKFISNNSVLPNAKLDVGNFGQIISIGELMSLSENEKEKHYNNIWKLMHS